MLKHIKIANKTKFSLTDQFHPRKLRAINFNRTRFDTGYIFYWYRSKQNQCFSWIPTSFSVSDSKEPILRVKPQEVFEDCLVEDDVDTSISNEKILDEKMLVKNSNFFNFFIQKKLFSFS